jgi:hypothetical protein
MKLFNVTKLTLIAALILASTTPAIIASKRTSGPSGRLQSLAVNNEMVQIRTADDCLFDVVRDVAMESRTINTMLSNPDTPCIHTQQQESLHFSNISGFTMEIILQCLWYITDDKTNPNQFSNAQDHIQLLIERENLSSDALIEVLFAANFLDIEPVIHAVASMYTILLGAIEKTIEHEYHPTLHLQTTANLPIHEALTVFARNWTSLVAYCKQLTTIKYLCSKITDFELITLVPHCPNLRMLNLEDCNKLTNVCAAAAPFLTGLESLTIQLCSKITDEGFKALARNCPRLESLNFHASKITAKGFMAFAQNCPHLKAIEPGADDFTDTDLEELAQCCPNLESIHFFSCSEITVAGLHVLMESCTQLKFIHPISCLGITDPDLQAICEMYPRLEIKEKELSWSFINFVHDLLFFRLEV